MQRRVGGGKGDVEEKGNGGGLELVNIFMVTGDKLFGRQADGLRDIQVAPWGLVLEDGISDCPISCDDGSAEFMFGESGHASGVSA